MSSLRKTQTNFVPANLPTSLRPSNSSVTARNLPKNDLGGVIFGCKHDTMMECLSKQLFGLPSPHFSYVRKIEHGLPLFLFNYSDRKMHGIYEAASCGSECSENRLDLNVEIHQSIAISRVDRESENLLQQSLSGEEIENGKEILDQLNSQSQKSEKKSDSDKLEREKEMVLSKLTRLAVSRDFVIQPSFVCLDDYDMCRNVQEDIKPLASEPHEITDENMITSDLSLENSKLAEIVKVLVERTTSLEKKQGEQEFTIQQLRGRVSKLESNLKSFTTHVDDQSQS
ncbi:hypothetical protein J5N97_014753 [Dioscorea zingiberensis]|uniref:DCD domain-containing protein n=1 Tax=Dioscorea zingiberensis TaxID=325984 RepID=A0A9D5HJY0_9LILI|nr:hypothetical protein J5N97_014753 [Dioscorea zingiberensis]